MPTPVVEPSSSIRRISSDFPSAIKRTSVVADLIPGAAHLYDPRVCRRECLQTALSRLVPPPMAGHLLRLRALAYYSVS
jgi:hypothetical protein